MTEPIPIDLANPELHALARSLVAAGEGAEDIRAIAINEVVGTALHDRSCEDRAALFVGVAVALGDLARVLAHTVVQVQLPEDEQPELGDHLHVLEVAFRTVFPST